MRVFFFILLSSSSSHFDNNNKENFNANEIMLKGRAAGKFKLQNKLTIVESL